MLLLECICMLFLLQLLIVRAKASLGSGRLNSVQSASLLTIFCARMFFFVKDSRVPLLWVREKKIGNVIALAAGSSHSSLQHAGKHSRPQM